MFSRIMSFVKRHPVSTFVIIASTILGCCAAPLLVINPFFLAGIGAASSLLFCGLVNCFKKKEPRPQGQILLAITHKEDKRGTKGEETKGEESELSQKKNWVIKHIRQTKLDRVLQEILTREISDKNNHDELDKWMRNQLVRGDENQRSILDTLRGRWIFNYDSTAFNFFKKCLLKEEKKYEQKSEGKSTEQKSAYLRLLDSDFKHISLHIEGFAVPFDKTSFKNLMKEAGESTITPHFFELLAKEGRLHYLEHILKQGEFKPNKELLFNAIRSAAENNYLPVVKYLISKLNEVEENEILPDIFSISLQKGYLGVFRWLLSNYEDFELNKSPMKIQLRIGASLPAIGGISSFNHALINTYQEIRRIPQENVVMRPSRT